MAYYLDQANINEEFHTKICEQFPDEFFDWKITVLFYGALHYINELALHWQVKIGDNHTEVFENMKPNRPHRKLPVKGDIYDAYNALYNYSRNSRYNKNKVPLPVLKEIYRDDHIDAIRRFNYIKKYVTDLLTK